MAKNEKVDDDISSEDTLYVDDSRRGRSSLIHTGIVVAIGIIAILVVSVSIS